jgi:hypothetical protein
MTWEKRFPYLAIYDAIDVISINSNHTVATYHSAEWQVQAMLIRPTINTFAKLFD